MRLPKAPLNQTPESGARPLLLAHRGIAGPRRWHRVAPRLARQVSPKHLEVNTMTKVELIAAVAATAGLTKKDAEKAVSATLDVITEALQKGDKVSLVGFGTFEVRERKERQGRNPQTREPMTIPASKLPAFSAGKALKDAVK
ncbi:MAG TPA: HU family DNA-binding protein [Candidatus Gemmiger avicola]|uniref:HU family DNA-binding protein n=1 Tax=Candidatus Gemmiger avicola TaxID=2838605 RepID=A0A9D2M561_9FIRM|nr:HU family DNA-binding protein [Candidatus Gemmiger avicola]